MRKHLAGGKCPAAVVADLSEPFAGVKERVRTWQDLSAAQLGMNRHLWQLVLDPAVTDILINAGEVWVDGTDGLRCLGSDPLDGQDLHGLAQNLAVVAGRRLDYSSPIVDAVIGENVRLHAVLPPIADPGPLISLRILHRQNHTFKNLVQQQMIDPGDAETLRLAVKERQSILICGATGTGKTTLLNALLSLVPHSQRILCIEESTELRPNHPHVVHLQERQTNVEGVGRVDAAELLRAALRMRPDRIVLGECRGAEVLDVMMALNTGHDGGLATIHANSIHEIPARLQALGALANVAPNTVAVQATAAFDLVVHLKRNPDGKRKVAEIGTLQSNTQALTGMSVQPLRGRTSNRAVSGQTDLGATGECHA